MQPADGLCFSVLIETLGGLDNNLQGFNLRMNALAVLRMLVIALPLTGCAGVDSAKSPRDTYNVEVSYEDAFKRAQEQAEYCLRGDTLYPIVASIDTQARRARVQVLDNFAGSQWARFDIVATGPKSSTIEGAVAGINIWDYAALRAMRAAIEFGVPSCTDYMPLERKSIRK
jgi:hypothetical protein